MTLKFKMEPRVSFLTELLGEIESGSLQIPRFQRTYVWTWQQQRDLLCSIYESLPIGSILIWSTQVNTIKAYDAIGPFKLKNPKVTGVSKAYLMDGLQRMTTLYSILHHPIERQNKNIKESELAEFKVFCDLNCDPHHNIEDMFIQSDNLSKYGYEPDQANLMPLEVIFDSKKYLKFQRKIPENQEAWIDRADDVVNAFKNYKIPVIPLQTDEQAIVTKSFERINSRGTKMSETHMLNALSYSEHFDLLKQIEELSEKHLAKFDSFEPVNEAFILMLIKMELGYDVFYKKTDKLAEKLTQDGKHEQILKKIFVGIEKFCPFAKDVLNIDKLSSFPYRLQAVALSYAFIKQSTIPQAKLKAWFIYTMYSGAFRAGAANSTSVLSDFKKMLNDSHHNFSWSLKVAAKTEVVPCSGKETIKSVRLKAWGMALAKKQGKQSEQLMLAYLLSKGSRAFKIPEELKSESSSLGAKFLVNGNERSFKIANLTPDQLSLHFIDEKALRLLETEELKQFCTYRENLIFKWEIKEIFNSEAKVLGQEEIILDDEGN